MAFRATDTNPLRDLVELRTAILAGEDGVENELKVELRIHPHEIEDRTWGTFAISFTQATLSLDIAGFSILPASKYGLPIASSTSREVVTETTVLEGKERGSDTRGGIAFKLSAVGPSGEANASRGRTSKTTTSTASKQTEKRILEHLPVKSIGNDNWLITAESGPLDAVFLNYETLCRIAPTWGGNRQATTASLLVKQKHINSIDLRPGMFSGPLQTMNQKRIAGILAAKSIHQSASDAGYTGVICLARSEVSDED